MYLNLIVFTVIFRLIGCSFGPRVTSDENVSLFTPLEFRTLVLLWVGKNKISQGSWSPWPSTNHVHVSKKELTKSHFLPICSSCLLDISSRSDENVFGKKKLIQFQRTNCGKSILNV